MTPKEKAQELFDKFYIEIYGFAKEDAKKFSLIAIDEIINASPIEPMTFLNGMRSNIPYWEEVKKEIEKL
jgi:hypothetical protein